MRPWSPGTHPNSNPVPSRRTIEEITWREIWKPWRQRNLIQTSAPYPAMWQSLLRKSRTMCSSEVKPRPDESRGVGSQLWKQPQLEHIQVHGTCHCLLDEEVLFSCIAAILYSAAAGLPSSEHASHEADF
ncbi:hypothetical protein AVEN_204656-1 [Araneus ventricosus]|uniref:Uncharacterized protein n=1 Tax=Araneus ventricosus TaxID=182803 RepID=A0A4Y2W190_ARAVE|nr:hypothetical protein AVEN_204656-1 [Araneus ventricosus]